MFPTKLSRAALALASLSLPAILNAQDLPGAGFALTPLPYPGQALSATLSNGDVLVFDGATIDRYAADGTHLVNYATFLVPVFTSFLVLDTNEHYALVGESSNMSISRLDLAGGTLAPLTALTFNYDAAQAGGDTWYISAATCGFSCGNDIWSLDATTGAATLEAQVAGASGPLSTDASGNLFYATVSSSFPAPPDSSNVVFFPAFRLAGPAVLTDADWFAIGVGFDGASDLAYDSVTGRAYLTENNFGTGTSRIYQVAATAAASPVLVEGQPFGWITNLELFQGPDPAVFGAFQPGSGGRLLYNNTDFFSTWSRNEVRPARPQLALSGPGASGPGRLDIGLSGAPGQGLALLAATPMSALLTGEVPLPLLSSLPVLSPFDLAQTIVLPNVLSVDAQGSGQITVLHQGDLLGQIAVQALAFSPDLSVIATSTVTLL